MRDREMFHAVKDTLLLAGYERYEISILPCPASGAGTI